MVEYSKDAPDFIVKVERFASNAFEVSVDGKPFCYTDNLKEASDEVAKIMKGEYWLVAYKGTGELF